MGNWGQGILQDDVADDARLLFEEALEGGQSVEAAIQGVLRECPWSLDDDEDAATIMLALAALELAHGDLSSTTRFAALAVIANGDAIARWEGSPPALVAQREAILHRFSEVLHRGIATREELMAITELAENALW